MGERISIERVGKTYSGGNRALEEITLEVERGTVLVLLGPSGSGKTTLLRSLAGIERITDGRLLIGDTVVAADGIHLPPERRNLSMVFQDYALWPHMSAIDNVAFALRRRGVRKPEGRRLAGEMLERVGLGALGARFPTELSGGEQQRVALARALIGGTDLVLCDEPLSNLDADLRERMRLEISALVREVSATTVYITHDQAEAFALADRVGVLERGRLVQFGAPEEIYSAPASPFVARFTGLAGELPVEVHASGPEPELVEIHAATRSSLRSLLGRSRARAVRGARATLLIRPTAVQLSRQREEESHLVGRVADVAFRGRGYEHAVELECGTKIHGVFSEVRVERGDAVWLRLDSAGCHVFTELAQSAPEETQPAALHALPDGLEEPVPLRTA